MLLFLFFIFKTTSVWFYSVSLGYLVSDPGLLKQCQVLALTPPVGLKLNQTLVGYCHKFYTTIVLVYFVIRTNYRSKVCGQVGVYISFSFGSLQSTFLHCKH